MNTWCSTGKTSASVGSGCARVCVGTDVAVAERPCQLVAVCERVLVCACVRKDVSICSTGKTASTTFKKKMKIIL